MAGRQGACEFQNDVSPSWPKSLPRIYVSGVPGVYPQGWTLRVAPLGLYPKASQNLVSSGWFPSGCTPGFADPFTGP